MNEYGSGLQARLDRALKENKKLRRDTALAATNSMNLTPGESMLLVERYHPTDIGLGWEPEAIRAWLDEQYAGAVYVEGDDT